MHARCLMSARGRLLAWGRTQNLVRIRWAFAPLLFLIGCATSNRSDDGGMPGGHDASLPGPSPSCPDATVHCSADLRSMLDCNGNVVSVCPDDQGCGASGCVPACDAAKANLSSVGCEYYVTEP